MSCAYKINILMDGQGDSYIPNKQNFRGYIAITLSVQIELLIDTYTTADSKPKIKHSENKKGRKKIKTNSIIPRCTIFPACSTMPPKLTLLQMVPIW